MMMKTQEAYGYTLDRIEIQNFGGYHGPSSIMRTDRSAMIFAGENGSGKTTALDALRLLFNQRPTFNSSSSQTGARDRDVLDYYLGRVKHMGAGADEGEVANAALRGFGIRSAPTAILAVFRTGNGRVFTAARLLHMPRAQDYRWRNVIIPGDRSLSGPLSDWPQAAKFREAIEAMGGRSFDTFDAYISALGDQFGLHGERRDRAFRILDDAVSQRGLDSVELFARKYILPESPLAVILENAEGQIALATEIMGRIERARTRLELLSSVSTGIGKYRKARSDHEKAMSGRDAVHLLKNHLQRRSARMMIRARGRAAERYEAEIRGLNEELARSEDEARRVEREIGNSGGDRLGEIRSEIKRMNDALIERGNREVRIRDLASRAGVRIPEDDAAAWDRTPGKAAAERDRLTALVGELEAERDAILRDMAAPEAELSAARQDLQSLERRRSAMPRPLLEARSALAEALGVPDEGLPFIGELIQIREGEESWEGVANRVLGAVARNVLIPSERYEDAKRVLSQRHWGTKVVLLREEEPKRDPVIAADSLAARLDTRPDSPFRDQVRMILADTASHVCVDEAGFGSARGRAVTRSGAVQSGTRAEKDDRRRVDDPSGWVLGWSVEPRRQALLKKVGVLETEVARMRDIAEQAKAGISTHRGRVSAIDVLSQVLCPHSEIDRSVLRTGLERLEAELDRILSGDLRRLEERKTDLIRSQNELRARISQLDKKIGSVESVVRAKRADLASAQDTARKLPRPGVEVRRAIPGLIARLADMCGVADGAGAGRLSGIAALEDRGEQIPWDLLTTEEEDTRERLIRALARAREGLNNLIMQARREFPEERHLSDQVFDGDRSSEQAMEDWILAEQDLRSQGIPELEGEYRARLDQVSGQAIGQINLAISTYRKEALSSIEKLNEILLKVVYNPSLNSCAQFRIRRVSDPVITAFEADLKTATGQVLNEDPDLSAVQRVIDRIREQDDPKSRADRTRLIDLANWYQVDVEELERLPDGGAGDRINLFDGPTAQSGGQKQRLMAVLFGVGVAHMFGIHEERMSENALRVMILDEAFSQLDPQGTQAAATLLRELGLQVILASPMTKIHAVSGVVSRMQLVSSDEGITRVEPVLMRAHLDRIERLRDGRNAQALAMLEEGAV